MRTRHLLCQKYLPSLKVSQWIGPSFILVGLRGYPITAQAEATNFFQKIRMSILLVYSTTLS